MAVVEDRYGEQARREFFDEVAEGTSARVNESLEVLDDRTLHQAWQHGDHEAVERWLDEAYARNEAVAETLRNDPMLMELMRQRMGEIDQRQAEEEARREVRTHQSRRSA